MRRRNPQDKESASGDASGTGWPGKIGASDTFPEDLHTRWYPTSWGAGFGPELDLPHPDSIARSESDSLRLKVSTPSFEIDMLCPNCGYARMTLDADERVSCPLCSFGGLCECGD